MLKLLVCFKMTYDLDSVSAEEWNRCLEEGGHPVFMKQILGAYDESALELALRLSDGVKAGGREVELTALSICDELSELVVANLFAVGYAHVIHVACVEDLRFRPGLVAGLIGAYVRREGGFDAILTGQQADVGDNGQTHLFMAERLCLPCVLHVTDAVWSCGRIRAISLTDEGILSQTITGSVILGVGNALHPYLRVATLRERLAASSKSVRLIPAEELGFAQLSGEPESVVQVCLRRERSQRNCRFIQGDSPGEKAQLLYDVCLKEVLKP